MNGTRKRTTTKLDGGIVEHLASFRSEKPLTLAEAQDVLRELAAELAGDDVPDVASAEVRVLGKGFRMSGAALVGITLVAKEHTS